MKKRSLCILGLLMFWIIGNAVATEWDKSLPASGDTKSSWPTQSQGNNSAIDRVLSGYRSGMAIIYSSASQVSVSPGEVVCSNSAGTVRKFRANTGSTTVTFSDIDTGTEASATTYYVYANCDAAADTATFKISTSSTAPSGVTSYKKLGSFYNNSSSDIDQNKIYTEPYRTPFTDSSGVDLGRFLAIYDYGTSTSSSTRRNPSTYFIAHGQATQSGGTATVTNLPFTSSSSYTIVCTRNSGSVSSQQIQVSAQSASSFSCSDTLSGSTVVNWIAFGY